MKAEEAYHYEIKVVLFFEMEMLYFRRGGVGRIEQLKALQLSDLQFFIDKNNHPFDPNSGETFS